MRRATSPARVLAAAVAPGDEESSAEVWRRWNRDQGDRDREARVAIEAHNAALTGPIYERELGEAIAAATAKMIPDWRLLRSEHPGWIRKLVAAQPESRVREAQQYTPLLRMIGDNLPGHIRAMVPDLEAFIELRAVAREASAFLIGCEVGRQQAHMYVNAKGRLVKRRQPSAPDFGSVGGGLRLHFAQDGGAR